MLLWFILQGIGDPYQWFVLALESRDWGSGKHIPVRGGAPLRTPVLPPPHPPTGEPPEGVSQRTLASAAAHLASVSPLNPSAAHCSGAGERRT